MIIQVKKTLRASQTSFSIPHIFSETKQKKWVSFFLFGTHSRESIAGVGDEHASLADGTVTNSDTFDEP